MSPWVRENGGQTVQRELTDLSQKISQVFGRSKFLDYGVAVRRLAGLCDPVLSEKRAMDAFDLAESAGRVAIDREHHLIARVTDGLR